MGAGVSTSNELVAQKFGFDVIKADFERYKAFRAECEERDELAYCEEEEAYLNSLPGIYAAAVKMHALDSYLCSCPAVLLHKFSQLSDEERNEYMSTFVEVVEVEEKKKAKAAKATAGAADYSQSFSGSAADTKAEKEAAKLMRGETDEEELLNPYLTPPVANTPREQALLRQNGKWHKYLGASNCFMYVHCMSREVLSMRPSDYEEEETAATTVGGADGADGAAAEEAKDPANGLPNCVAVDLPAEVERIQKEGQTVLVLDPSEEQVALQYYSYKANLEDASSLTIPFAKGGVKRGELMERLRKGLVGALKAGRPFVLYLGGTTCEHADFKKKLCKKDVFPNDTFIDSGKRLIKSSVSPKYKLLYREEDLEQGEAVVRDGFSFMVISSLDPWVFEEALESTLPLGYMQPLFLKV